jgi:proteasome lid subunit RPN8/RPN11
MKNSVQTAGKTPAKKKPSGEPKLFRRPLLPSLRFSTYAWAKLVYLRDAGGTEIGGFGITARDRPLLVQDVRLVRQQCDWASVSFDDEAVADFFDEQVDLGRRPEEFARVWVHTHPGDSPLPSLTDEETFGRVFGACDWAVMFILAQRGQSYARLQFGVGPTGSAELPVEVAFEEPFAASDHATWQAEYEACVRAAQPMASASATGLASDRFGWLDEYELNDRLHFGAHAYEQPW